ncbi:MAG TPA: hypothetical protein VM848_09970 [Acidimicrobiia bacterium]|nr:hypothetical protein [Acidimicrobiia bacterium]
MTDTLTTTRERTQEVSARRGRFGRRRIVVSALLAGVLAGGAVFAVAQPSAEEIERAYWDQVVAYYEQRYQTMTSGGSIAEAGSAASVGSTGSSGSLEQAHWAAVVDYYEQQWAARQR